MRSRDGAPCLYPLGLRQSRAGKVRCKSVRVLGSLGRLALLSSRGWAVAAEGAEDLVEVGGDGDFVIEEVLQPEIIVPVGQGNQGEQVSQANMDARGRALELVALFGRRIHSQVRGHSRSSLRCRAKPGSAPEPDSGPDSHLV